MIDYNCQYSIYNSYLDLGFEYIIVHNKFILIKDTFTQDNHWL